MNFWDSSALVPLLSTEPGSPRFRALLKKAPLQCVWWGSRVECHSALQRERRAGRLSDVEERNALAILRRLESGWMEIQPSEAVRNRAEALLRRHPLRAADSLQLAAALEACEGIPARLPFACADERLREAATREGFQVLG